MKTILNIEQQQVVDEIFKIPFVSILGDINEEDMINYIKNIDKDQFNNIIKPLYNWAIQLKMLNKFKEKTIYIGKIYDNIIIQLGCPGVTLNVPKNLKNVVLGWCGGTGHLIVQDLDSIYDWQNNVYDITTKLKTETLKINNTEYKKLCNIYLKRVKGAEKTVNINTPNITLKNMEGVKKRINKHNRFNPST